MSNNKKAAFTIIEILMAISLVAILSAVSISQFTSTLDEARFDATYKEMLQLRKAILGDLENTTVEGDRLRFGFLGDVGAIPTAAQGLNALTTRPTAVGTSLAAWSLNSTADIGAGWNGPYLTDSVDGDHTKDAWGRNYIYNPSASVPYILSYGSDGAAGGNGTAQDIEVSLPLSIRTATVNGQIISSGSVYEGDADVFLYYASAGAVASYSTSLTSANQGTYSFSNVPFGLRTAKVVIPNSTSPMMTIGPVSFTVDNEKYSIPTTLLEVNPLTSDANCNTISNISYVDGSMYNDTSNNKVTFQVNINKSFTTKSLYVTNNGGASGTSLNLEQIGIGGVVYGCTDIIDLVLYGGIDRKFTQCATTTWLFFTYDLGYVNLNTYPNLTLSSTWGMPAGSNVQAYMKFNSSTASLTRMNLRIGCDLMTIE